jgi:hypothetical protein
MFSVIIIESLEHVIHSDILGSLMAGYKEAVSTEVPDDCGQLMIIILISLENLFNNAVNFWIYNILLQTWQMIYCHSILSCCSIHCFKSLYMMSKMVLPRSSKACLCLSAPCQNNPPRQCWEWVHNLKLANSLLENPCLGLIVQLQGIRCQQSPFLPFYRVVSGGFKMVQCC